MLSSFQLQRDLFLNLELYLTFLTLASVLTSKLLGRKRHILLERLWSLTDENLNPISVTC